MKNRIIVKKAMRVDSTGKIPASRFLGAWAFRQNQISAVSLLRHTTITDRSFDRDVTITRRE